MAPPPDNVLIEAFKIECDKNVRIDPWGNSEDLARQIGNVVRATALAFERQGMLPPLRNVLVDYPPYAYNPKFKVTLEFV